MPTGSWVKGHGEERNAEPIKTIQIKRSAEPMKNIQIERSTGPMKTSQHHGYETMKALTQAPLAHAPCTK